jgi:hypothetical protein
MESGISLSAEALFEGVLRVFDGDTKVVVWVTRSGAAIVEAKRNLTIVRYTAGELSLEDVKSLLQKDVLNIFQMGNNEKFHKDIASVMAVVPGIVILHDGVLYDLYYQGGFSRMQKVLHPVIDRETFTQVNRSWCFVISFYPISRDLLVSKYALWSSYKS